MATICKSCNRRIEGRKSDHVCDLVTLTDGRIVHRDRVDNYDGDLRKEIEAGKVKVERRHKPEPVRSTGSKFPNMTIGGSN